MVFMIILEFAFVHLFVVHCALGLLRKELNGMAFTVVIMTPHSTLFHALRPTIRVASTPNWWFTISNELKGKLEQEHKKAPSSQETAGRRSYQPLHHKRTKADLSER